MDTKLCINQFQVKIEDNNINLVYISFYGIICPVTVAIKSCSSSRSNN